MKKFMSLLLTMLMVLSLTACGGKTDDGGADTTTPLLNPAILPATPPAARRPSPEAT